MDFVTILNPDNFLDSTLKYASLGPRVIHVMIIRVVSNHEFSPFKFCMYISISWHAVVQLVEAPYYKPEGRGFDRVIGISHCCNPSSPTMALTSTHLLTKMSTGGISWG